MSYPLIIFGAGASYDYSPEIGSVKISPLTKNLVDKEFLAEDLMGIYEGAGDLLNEIISSVRSGSRSFEEALTEFRDETKHSARIRSQFIALEFYLRDLFGRISSPDYVPRDMFSHDREKIHQLNNYRKILSKIHTYSDGRACIVTFNYDTLFEDSLPMDLRPQKMSDYVSKDIKIIKPHGSHNWAYVDHFTQDDFERLKVKDEFGFCCRHDQEYLEKLRNSDAGPLHNTEIREKEKMRKTPYNRFPAIAVPLIGKDIFVCPGSHINELKNTAKDIDRVLVIGWRAGDPLLLKTLKESLSKSGYKVLIVSSTLESAKEIKKLIVDSLGIDHSYVETRGGGFSKFMNSSNDFFRS